MNYCEICGETAPEGKNKCWVCEHTPKLHKTDDKECSDKCEIKFDEKKGG